MNTPEALAALQAAGSEQTRKTYRRHGVTGDLYGVSYATLEKLRKSIGTNQSVAAELWASGNHDARVLATMVANPEQLTEKTLTRWAKDLDNDVLGGALATLASRTPLAEACFEKWSAAGNDRLSAAGWHVLAEMAGSAHSRPDAFFAARLAQIERDIHQAPNRTRYSMNGALIAIGCRNPYLEGLALAAAHRVGKVEVDHGDTDCKTPDAATYIRKVAARKSGKKLHG